MSTQTQQWDLQRQSARTQTFATPVRRGNQTVAPRRDRLDEMRRRDAERAIAHIERCYRERLPIPRLG
jgi:hypothetical protein